jgi:hypothetical protein
MLADSQAHFFWRTLRKASRRQNYAEMVLTIASLITGKPEAFKVDLMTRNLERTRSGCFENQDFLLKARFATPCRRELRVVVVVRSLSPKGE